MFGFIFNKLEQWQLLKLFKHRSIVIFMWFRYSFSPYFIWNNVTFLKCLMLISDKLLLSSQPLLISQLPFPGWWLLIVVFNNMRTLKFKPLNQRFLFFAAVNHLSGPLRKQKLTSARSKGHVCGSWLVDFDPFCLFLCFNRQLGFELQSSHVIENRNNRCSTDRSI